MFIKNDMIFISSVSVKFFGHKSALSLREETRKRENIRQLYHQCQRTHTKDKKSHDCNVSGETFTGRPTPTYLRTLQRLKMSRVLKKTGKITSQKVLGNHMMK